MTFVMLTTCVTLEVSDSYEDILDLVKGPNELEGFHDSEGRPLSLDTRHIVAVAEDVGSLKPVFIPPTEEDIAKMQVFAPTPEPDTDAS